MLAFIACHFEGAKRLRNLPGRVIDLLLQVRFLPEFILSLSKESK